MESLIRDLTRSLLFAIVGIFLLLAWAFRSLRLAFVGLASSALPIVFGLAYMTLRGIPLGTATVIVFSVALGLAVDGTIHVVSRYSQAASASEDALVRAIEGSGPAIIATCLTLVAGFGVLGISSFVPLRYFGELIAISIAASLICQLILLPPLLAVFDKTSYAAADG